MAHDTTATLWSTVKIKAARLPARSRPRRRPPVTSLTREQTVDQILSINPSASCRFLAQFATRQLGSYLDHLLAAETPRGRLARWVRPGDAPAIMAGPERV